MKPQMDDIKTSNVREALLKIASQNDGALDPRAVVEAARSSKSPLHSEFIWDDGEAAELYRLAQAGALIRRVKLVIMRPEKEDKVMTLNVTRQFQSRPSQRGNRGYERVEDIMADTEKREEMLQQVLKELEAYKCRYENLVELEGVWSAIDEALASQPKKAKRA